MTSERRVVVAGATGLIGKAFSRELLARGYQLVVLARDPGRAREALPGAAEYLGWDAFERNDAVLGAIDGAYALVNLAGTPVFGRWTESYKRKIRDSRIQRTRLLVDAMASVARRPQVFLSGSAIGYYGERDATQLDEQAAPGDDFLARVVIDWEAEAQRAETLGIRTVMIRSGIVLDRREGSLPLMSLSFRLLAGGPILPGTQYVSWIHIADEVGLLLLALEDSRVRGPLNATAPEPQTNREFMAAIGRTLGTPSWIPVPGFALEALFGGFARSLTSGQRVLPAKALELGYRFQFSNSASALANLLKDAE